MHKVRGKDRSAVGGLQVDLFQGSGLAPLVGPGKGATIVLPRLRPCSVFAEGENLTGWSFLSVTRQLRAGRPCWARSRNGDGSVIAVKRC